MKAKLLGFFQDESGQTSTEYILLVAVVALIVFKFKGIAVEQLQKITTNVFGAAETMSEQLNDELQNN